MSDHLDLHIVRSEHALAVHAERWDGDDPAGYSCVKRVFPPDLTIQEALQLVPSWVSAP